MTLNRSLLELGKWLKVNGQAIYGTSPWFIFGEGPTVIESEDYAFHHSDHFAKIKFTEKDIRFTVNGEYLYAICLGQPSGEVKIRALNSTFKVKKEDLCSISLLGSDQLLKWDHNEEALVIQLPKKKVSEYAIVFKIDLN